MTEEKRNIFKAACEEYLQHGADRNTVYGIIWAYADDRISINEALAILQAMADNDRGAGMWK